LILDDLGTESATPWAREKLFQLLNYRYAARLPTVITTFSTLEELDERLASRMEDSSRCTVHGITAPSYRGSRTQQVGKRVYEPPGEDIRPEGRRGSQAPQAAKRAMRKPRNQ
jgi:DNA replication protein DnaC